jgi:hypothetical protein
LHTGWSRLPVFGEYLHRQSAVRTGLASGQKKTPENRGRSLGGNVKVTRRRRRISRRSVFKGSQPAMGQVAVADGNPGMGHQNLVDGGHQAAKQAGRRAKAEGSGFGHLGALVWRQPVAASSSETNLGIPDTSHNTFVCIAAIGLLQCSINRVIGFPNEKSRPEGRPLLRAGTLRSGHPKLRTGPLLAIGREADPREAQQHHCPCGWLRYGGGYRHRVVSPGLEGERAVVKLIIG